MLIHKPSGVRAGSTPAPAFNFINFFERVKKMATVNKTNLNKAIHSLSADTPRWIIDIHAGYRRIAGYYFRGALIQERKSEKTTLSPGRYNFWEIADGLYIFSPIVDDDTQTASTKHHYLVSGKNAKIHTDGGISVDWD